MSKNHIEVWNIENEYEIEEIVNRYCEAYEFNPLSVSITYVPHKNFYTVVLVVADR